MGAGQLAEPQNLRSLRLTDYQKSGAAHMVQDRGEALLEARRSQGVMSWAKRTRSQAQDHEVVC